MTLLRPSVSALALVWCLACLCAACGADDADEGGGQERGDGGDDETDERRPINLGDGSIIDRDGGDEPGVIVLTCEGVDDGTSCGSMGGLICLDDECVTSTCGDGFADPRAQEECDDGNGVPADGCEPNCRYMCKEVGDCDDGNACNGNEVCDTAGHLCVAGGTAQDETPCSSSVVSDGECRSGTCVPKGCGDESVEGDEECDDGNVASGDGCEPTCTFTCEEDVDCNDNDVCNGEESCDAEAHVCVLGPSLECDAPDACSVGTCDPVAGCQLELIDGDGDRFAPIMDGCGDDCDDSRADVNPGQAELCDEIDQNCDGEPQPESAPTWYVDCDGDGFAPERAASQDTCIEPPPSSCGGRWTTKAPEKPETTDCYDENGSVYPGQTGWFVKSSGNGYDFDCSTEEEPRYPNFKTSTGAACYTSERGGCSGAAGWVGGVAACGDRAEYTECQGGLAIEAARAIPIVDPIPCGIRGCTCARVVIERTQECR